MINLIGTGKIHYNPNLNDSCNEKNRNLFLYTNFQLKHNTVTNVVDMDDLNNNKNIFTFRVLMDGVLLDKKRKCLVYDEVTLNDAHLNAELKKIVLNYGIVIKNKKYDLMKAGCSNRNKENHNLCFSMMMRDFIIEKIINPNSNTLKLQLAKANIIFNLANLNFQIEKLNTYQIFIIALEEINRIKKLNILDIPILKNNILEQGELIKNNIQTLINTHDNMNDVKNINKNVKKSDNDVDKSEKNVINIAKNVINIAKNVKNKTMFIDIKRIMDNQLLIMNNIYNNYNNILQEQQQQLQEQQLQEQQQQLQKQQQLNINKIYSFANTIQKEERKLKKLNNKLITDIYSKFKIGLKNKIKNFGKTALENLKQAPSHAMTAVKQAPSHAMTALKKLISLNPHLE